MTDFNVFDTYSYYINGGVDVEEFKEIQNKNKKKDQTDKKYYRGYIDRLNDEMKSINKRIQILQKKEQTSEIRFLIDYLNKKSRKIARKIDNTLLKAEYSINFTYKDEYADKPKYVNYSLSDYDTDTINDRGAIYDD